MNISVKSIHELLSRLKVTLREIWRRVIHKDIINKGLVFQDKYKGKRCFVIGTGPSLTPEDLNKIKDNGDVSFASNRIFKIFDRTEWRPDFYVVCDGTVYDDSVEDIKMLNSPKFFPLDFLPRLKYKALDNSFFFYRLGSHLFFDKPKFSSNLKRRFGEGGTVTYHLIQLAASMGFKEIYLLGIDFNYSKSIGPNGEVIDDPSVKNYSVEDRKVMYTMPNLYYGLLAYNSAKDYASKHHFKIYNATRGGKLEVFERVDFDSLFVKK